MPRHSILSPLSVLLAGLLVIVLALAGGGVPSTASSQRGHGTPTVTPCEDDDPEVCDPENQGDLGDTPTPTDSGYPYEAPGTPTPTLDDTSTPTVSQEPTGTLTGTFTPEPTDPAEDSTPTFAPQPEGTAAPAAVPPLPSPTPTPEAQLACLPNVPLIITGSAPPRAPLLLYFGQRAVGGGSAGPNGDFSLKLIVGQERAGDYQVTVRVRGTSQVLRELTCSVPATPVPTPLGRR